MKSAPNQSQPNYGGMGVSRPPSPMGNNGGAIKMPPQMSPPRPSPGGWGDMMANGATPVGGQPPPSPVSGGPGGMAGMVRNAMAQREAMSGGQPPAPSPGGGRPGMMGNFRRQMGQMGGGQPPPPNPQMAMAQGLRRGGGMRMR